MPRTKQSSEKRRSSGAGDIQHLKRSKVHSSIQITEINTTKECVHLHNFGKAEVDLEGLSVADIRGNAKSQPFPSVIVKPGQTVLLWTAPGYIDGAPQEEDSENIFWRNRSNGNPRSRPVLNNDGDGVVLLDSKGGMITMSYTSGSDDEGEGEDASEAATESLLVETSATSTATPGFEKAAPRHLVIQRESFDDSALWKQFVRSMDAVEKRVLKKYT